MRILVTNDDGVNAPGLLALVQAVRPFGEVSVLAPGRNWSACGHVKTLDRPLHVSQVTLADGTPALSTDGAPSDCVALVMLGLLPRPNLVVAGVNPLPNLGHDLTYSGTVTAAMEAVISGVPGLAFSQDTPDHHHPRLEDFAPIMHVIRVVVQRVMEHGLPENVALNVNVPNLPPGELRGYRITCAGPRIYHDKLVRGIHPDGQPYYWIGGEAPTGTPLEGTDVGALARGCASIMPVHLDLTAHHLLEDFAAWDWPPDTG